MTKALLALGAAAVVATTAPLNAAPVTGQVCTKWRDGVCVSTHRVRGSPNPYAVGYVFGPTYSYTPIADLPQPVVTYYKLEPNYRYVYSNGYVYVIDPSTYAVIRVIDTFSH